MAREKSPRRKVKARRAATRTPEQLFVKAVDKLYPRWEEKRRAKKPIAARA